MSRKNLMNNDSLIPMPTKNLFEVQRVCDVISTLLGEVLTVVDASTEGDKNKAIKDLIKQRFSNTQSWFYERAYEVIGENRLLTEGVIPKN